MKKTSIVCRALVLGSMLTFASYAAATAATQCAANCNASYNQCVSGGGWVRFCDEAKNNCAMVCYENYQ